MEFKKLKLNDNLISCLTMQGFLTPTKIQEKFIPKALVGCDILAKSETGSGKTLAYLLPILNNVKQDGIQALIVVPTKELALQVKQTLNSFIKFTNLNIATVVGGSDFTRQRFALKTANIVIGTTGRLIDHINRRTLKLHKLNYLVLDEADEMLDMGFVNDIKQIYKACPKQKQTFMLSATFNDKVKNLANEFLNKPEIIEFSKDNKIVNTVEQCYILCVKKGKFETLTKFLNTLYKEKTIIFVNTKKMAEELFFKLKDKEITSCFLHGDLTLNERKANLNKFKNNTDILIATDVASRGLDINNVTYIINYDMPQDSETYIHRLGRTARAGKSGLSLSLINSQTQLDFLINNFANYKLTELKVKRDDKLNKNIFVKTHHEEFDFNAPQNPKFKKKKQTKPEKIKENKKNKTNKNNKKIGKRK